MKPPFLAQKKNQIEAMTMAAPSNPNNAKKPLLLMWFGDLAPAPMATFEEAVFVVARLTRTKAVERIASISSTEDLPVAGAMTLRETDGECVWLCR